jgi:hypothetical protein
MPPTLEIVFKASDHNPCGIRITAAMGSLPNRARWPMPWERIKKLTIFLESRSNLVVK